MFATLVGEPFLEAEWVYEEKYDGIRILPYKEGSHVTLLSRNDRNRTESFPAIAPSVGALRPPTLLLDGDVSARDRHIGGQFATLGSRSAARIASQIVRVSSLGARAAYGRRA